MQIFEVKFPSLWAGIFIDCKAKVGDPDILASAEDSTLLTYNWRSINAGSDTLGISRESVTGVLYLAVVPRQAAVTYTLQLSQLSAYQSVSLNSTIRTEVDVQTSESTIFIDLPPNQHFRFVDYLGDIESTRDILLAIVGSSNEANSWNNLVKPYLLNTLNETVNFQTISRYSCKLTFPAIPNYTTLLGENLVINLPTKLIVPSTNLFSNSIIISPKATKTISSTNSPNCVFPLSLVNSLSGVTSTLTCGNNHYAATSTRLYDNIIVLSN